MKKIEFKWSNTIYIGNIIEQTKSSILGMKTVIKTVSPLEQEFTIFGKCSVGYCGPFNVISIS